MDVRRLGVWLLLTVGLMAASSTVTWWVTHPPVEAPPSAVPASLVKDPQFQRFVSTYQLIRQQSIWKNSPRQLLLGATNGMVGTLHDPFSDYLTTGQTHQLTDLLDPSYVGIGVRVSLERPLRIESVYPGTPAAKAGLNAGGEVLAVNGHSTRLMSPDGALNLIRGKVGTAVTLTVETGHVRRTVTLIRQDIPYPTVTSKMLPGHIAYIRIKEFGQNTGIEAVAQFHQLMAMHPRGILLDLRDNPGGEVTEALQVANLFVPKGPVVTLKYKQSAKDITEDSQGPGTTLPVVVLVNGNTASATEILSAAISERQGGRLVGTRTGKGIVQAVIPFLNGASLKLTVARYLTPDGEYIEHKGLTPNIIVAEPPSVVPSDIPSQDPQLRAGLIYLNTMIARGINGR